MTLKIWRTVMCALPPALLAGCSGNSGSGPVPPPQQNTLFGTARPMGKGSVRSFVTKNSAGTPVSVGVELSEAALNGLPAQGTPYEIALPAGAPRTQFDHFSIDWEPEGHVPPGVYNVPHFDVHFYMMTPAQQAAITPGTDSNTPAPEARFVAPDYVSTVDTVPFMGVHYIDSKAPELNPPQPFEKTLIYGYNKGHLAFIEPMVSRQFLQNKTDFSGAVKLPAAYQRAGYYPTRYSISYDATAKTYKISLDELALH